MIHYIGLSDFRINWSQLPLRTMACLSRLKGGEFALVQEEEINLAVKKYEQP